LIFWPVVENKKFGKIVPDAVLARIFLYRETNARKTGRQFAIDTNCHDFPKSPEMARFFSSSSLWRKSLWGNALRIKIELG